MKHKMKSRLPGEISITYADDTTFMAESEEKLKSLLVKVKEGVKKFLKAQHSENEDHGIWSHHFIGNRWGNSGNNVSSELLDPALISCICKNEMRKCAYL